MPDPVQCEIALAMNEDGSWVVVPWDEDAVAKMNEDHGGAAVRVAKIIATMSPPVVPEVEVTIPDDAGETFTAEAEEEEEAA